MMRKKRPGILGLKVRVIAATAMAVLIGLIGLAVMGQNLVLNMNCLLYTSPSPRD